ncbi:Phage shock protein PspC (stress-responsive transcriptional regulator) [Parapedobacter composti]|uniref:Phage shock protein PspC (Stress-responsive transcriptional regulator) n=1 Tax=Parapedobacter composti TaxID=623281 RepID=A0A1I1IF27_9SPHI|nr:PspC domain-containing protein [Parapedobacter composti]SFC34755.1 Phage shock protein PspC (stress-responsive transcriptional regulator) [Parapedobacter composti]
MNKTIIININGIVFHIEEDAYEVLRAYMIDVKRHFGNTADSQEIVEDIENRIAEMFGERIVQGRKEVITMADVNEVITQMGQVSDFEGAEVDDSSSEAFYDVPPISGQRKLMRDPDDKVFGGVCSGLGHYFGIEARWIRLFLVLLFIFGGAGFLLYIILWIVMPLATTRADRMAMRGETPNLQNFKRSFQEEMEGLRSNFTGAEEGLRKGLNSAGNFVVRTFIILAKIIGVLFIMGLCVGFVVLAIAIVASFGFFGSDTDMAMFPLNVIEPGFRTPMLISALFVAIIPFLALVGLVIRILFNKNVIGRYTGFTLLVAWLIAVGFTTVYGTRTLNDFREESTVVEERPLEQNEVYQLSRNDLTVIRLQNDSLDRLSRIRQRALVRNNHLSEGQNRMYMRVVRIDTTQAPSITYEYSARGATYELAADRAGRIDYRMEQRGAALAFDSHFNLQRGDLMRDQRLYLKLNIPVGTKLVIDRDLQRHILDLPFNQCEKNHGYPDGNRPDKTEWIMTESGLKCTAMPPPVEDREIIDTVPTGIVSDSIEVPGVGKP